MIRSIRPFLITVGFRQSKTAFFATGFFFTGFFWSFLSSVESIFDFIVFALFLEAIGVRELVVGSSLCFAHSPRATARRTLVPASWWLWT